jgi:hypothetical protein
MTKVMAGMFAIMLAAFALASSYLAGDLTSDQVTRMFGF